MRFFTSTLAIVSIALALTACTGKSSSSSDQSNATATTGAEATAAASSDQSMTTATSAAEASAAPSSDIPSYPGATTQASGTSSNMMTQNASGTVMTTGDSFDSVYQWYQKNMPAGSERAHVTTPAPSALFVTVGGKQQASVSITTNAGKTVITIAHVGIR